MEAKSDTCNSQKYECGDGNMDWLAMLALSYFSENDLQSDAVLQLEDRDALPAYSDTCSSQKYECGDGNMDWLATLALSYFSVNDLQSDAVLQLDDGNAFPVHRETLWKCSEYFRFVCLLIWLINM
jgi:hypothetical protein